MGLDPLLSCSLESPCVIGLSREPCGGRSRSHDNLEGMVPRAVPKFLYISCKGWVIPFLSNNYISRIKYTYP